MFYALPPRTDGQGSLEFGSPEFGTSPRTNQIRPFTNYRIFTSIEWSGLNPEVEYPAIAG